MVILVALPLALTFVQYGKLVYSSQGKVIFIGVVTTDQNNGFKTVKNKLLLGNALDTITRFNVHVNYEHILSVFFNWLLVIYEACATYHITKTVIRINRKTRCTEIKFYIFAFIAYLIIFKRHGGCAYILCGTQGRKNKVKTQGLRIIISHDKR